MRKFMNIFLAVLITLFSFPIGGLNVSAEGNDRVTPDEAYEVEFTILQEDKEGDSIADGYFQKPGVLLKYDGNTYLQMTINSADMVRAFSNEYGEYVLVDKSDESMTMQLRVPNDLFDMKLDMHIVVPGGAIPGFPGYDAKHGAFLTIDQDSKQEVNTENYNLVTSEGKNGPSVEISEPEEKEDGDSEGEPGDSGTDPEEDQGDDDGSPGEKDEEGENDSDEGNSDSTNLVYAVDVPTMERYMDNVTLVNIGGDNLVTFRFNSQQFIDNFEVKQSGEFIESDNVVVDGNYVEYTFSIADLSETLATKITIDANGREMVHEFNVDFVDYKKAMEIAYAVDVPTMERYMDNVTLVNIGGDNLVTFRFNSQQFIDNFEVKQSGEFIESDNVVVDGNYVEYTFSIADLSETLATKITIDANGREMVHEFNVDFVDYKEEKEVIEIVAGDKATVAGNQTLEISNSETGEKFTIETPQSLPDNTGILVDFKDEEDKDVQNAIENKYKVAGPVVDVTLEGDIKLQDSEKFVLTLPYDAEKYNADEYDVDIYYFDGSEWVAQEGDVNNGQISIEVEGFSTYGVFAKEKPEKTEDPTENNGTDDEGKEEETTVLTPDKAYEINYTILDKNGKDKSIADNYFTKPGILLEYDGKTYLQMTVESAEMVRKLSNEYGNYLLVDEKDDTKTMQLRVPNDLSDMELKMHIVVPPMTGFPGYDSEHDAILTFDQNSQSEVDANNYTLVATNKDDGNGPFDKDAEDPTPSPTPTPTPKPTPTPGDKGEIGEGSKDKDEETSLKPEKAYEINYTIMHENEKEVSVADGFFRKPGILLEYGGKTYLQMTVESADMVKALSNKYGDYILVSNNADGTVTIQLRVPNDLSDMKLNMHIVVPAGAIPGFPGYDEKHGAILTFDKASKKEISVEGLEVAPSGDKNNLNGPYVEGAPNPDPSEEDNNGKQPDKPELGENGDNKKGEKTDENPKTGDTSQILFFSTLLVASLSVLVLQVRRRLAA